jgi:PelA/Pel-15E family pectate lyase
VTFLREAESQTAEIQAATAAAVQWLRETQLSGIRIERISAPKEDYLRHSTDFDFIVVQDSAAPPIWARHYEIGTNRPVFASRDGVMRYSLSEIDRERRTGTAWYGGWPLSVLSPDFKQP